MVVTERSAHIPREKGGRELTARRGTHPPPPGNQLTGRCASTPRLRWHHRRLTAAAGGTRVSRRSGHPTPSGDNLPPPLSLLLDGRGGRLARPRPARCVTGSGGGACPTSTSGTAATGRPLSGRAGVAAAATHAPVLDGAAAASHATESRRQRLISVGRQPTAGGAPRAFSSPAAAAGDGERASFG